MELKPTAAFDRLIATLAFNRTSMELKRATSKSYEFPIQTFNRTSMELKRMKYFANGFSTAGLLIEPVWN